MNTSKFKVKARPESLPRGLLPATVTSGGYKEKYGFITLRTGKLDYEYQFDLELAPDSMEQRSLEAALNHKMTPEESEGAINWEEAKGNKVIALAEVRGGPGGKPILTATALFTIEDVEKAVHDFRSAFPPEPSAPTSTPSSTPNPTK